MWDTTKHMTSRYFFLVFLFERVGTEGKLRQRKDHIRNLFLSKEYIVNKG